MDGVRRSACGNPTSAEALWLQPLLVPPSPQSRARGRVGGRYAVPLPHMQSAVKQSQPEAPLKLATVDGLIVFFVARRTKGLTAAPWAVPCPVTSVGISRDERG